MRIRGHDGAASARDEGETSAEAAAAGMEARTSGATAEEVVQ